MFRAVSRPTLSALVLALVYTYLLPRSHGVPDDGSLANIGAWRLCKWRPSGGFFFIHRAKGAPASDRSGSYCKPRRVLLAAACSASPTASRRRDRHPRALASPPCTRPCSATLGSH